MAEEMSNRITVVFCYENNKIAQVIQRKDRSVKNGCI